MKKKILQIIHADIVEIEGISGGIRRIIFGVIPGGVFEDSSQDFLDGSSEEYLGESSDKLLKETFLEESPV